jgi:hypothetical protein
VARPDDQTPTAAQRLQGLEVRRMGRGRFVLRVGDEIRTCADRDLPQALRQALGLAMEDARALAAELRANTKA